MSIRLIIVIVLGAILSGCGKQDRPGAVGGNGSDTGNSKSTPEIVTKSGVEMVNLPAGQFTMGSDQGNPDEAPPHKVSVTGFLMDKYPVTHEMYVKAQLPNPS